MNAILIALGAFIATFLGGFFALYFRDKLHLILGFSAGAVIGVAFFDLMPEALNLEQGVHTPEFVLSIVALGFVIYMIFDRTIFFHSHSDGEECKNEHHHHSKIEKSVHNHRADTGAGTLSIHSFLDGVAIGLAFKVSLAVAIIVAVAVLAHDFSDGINTVNMVIRGGGSGKRALRWLFIDALAPIGGVLVTIFFAIPGQALGLPLALFAGFFLYIGASDLLPESHHSHRMILTTCMTIMGMCVLYFAVHFAG